jgi:hypothetical protein
MYKKVLVIKNKYKLPNMAVNGINELHMQSKKQSIFYFLFYNFFGLFFYFLSIKIIENKENIVENIRKLFCKLMLIF